MSDDTLMIPGARASARLSGLIKEGALDHITSPPPRLTLAVGRLHQSPVIMARQSLRCAEIGWAGLICIKLLQRSSSGVRQEKICSMMPRLMDSGQQNYYQTSEIINERSCYCNE